MDNPEPTVANERDSLLVALGSLTAQQQALLNAIERGNEKWGQIGEQLSGVLSQLEVRVEAEPVAAPPEPTPEPTPEPEPAQIEAEPTKPAKRRRAQKWMQALRRKR